MDAKQDLPKDLDSVIVAICSPPGRGAIALIRVSGPKADLLVDKCSKIAGKTTLGAAKTHTIHFGQIIDRDGRVIDQVLFLLMRSPKSFTGQDTVEITCHGNPIIASKIIEVLLEAGAKIAAPGEFTKRAFFNEKLDLIQAEAIHELVMADSQFSIDQSMRKLSAGLSFEIEKLENMLIKLISILEASFEFLEEEERDVDFKALVHQHFDQLLESSLKLKKSVNHSARSAGAIKIAILGVPNAGKSTLFNALLGQERAIVCNSPGTTRDSIEHHLSRKEQLWALCDTAGIRKTSKFVEHEGIKRSFDQAAQADLILFAVDPCGQAKPQLELFEKLKENFEHKLLPILTKTDLFDQKENNFSKNFNFFAQVSGKTGHGVLELEKKIEEKVKRMLEGHSSNFVLNERQRLVLSQFLSQLQTLHEKLQNNVPVELLIIDLREMAQDLSTLNGKNIQEKVLSEVFANFCVGK